MRHDRERLIATNGLSWWWVRVPPPPGSLIWRFPGLIRPRCTAGATHHVAESYYRIEAHGKIITRAAKPVVFGWRRIDALIMEIKVEADFSGRAL